MDQEHGGKRVKSKYMHANGPDRRASSIGGQASGYLMNCSDPTQNHPCTHSNFQSILPFDRFMHSVSCHIFSFSLEEMQGFPGNWDRKPGTKMVDHIFLMPGLCCRN